MSQAKPVYNILKVEPPSERYREEDVLFIDLAKHPIGQLQVAAYLVPGESLSWDDLFNQMIAKAPDPGTEKGREEEADRLNDECGAIWCELLNFILGATREEVSERVIIELLEVVGDNDKD